jgi:hypothetical protein
MDHSSHDHHDHHDHHHMMMDHSGHGDMGGGGHMCNMNVCSPFLSVTQSQITKKK